jgi:hypothetical protein
MSSFVINFYRAKNLPAPPTVLFDGTQCRRWTAKEKNRVLNLEFMRDRLRNTKREMLGCCSQHIVESHIPSQVMLEIEEYLLCYELYGLYLLARNKKDTMLSLMSVFADLKTKYRFIRDWVDLLDDSNNPSDTESDTETVSIRSADEEEDPC